MDQEWVELYDRISQSYHNDEKNNNYAHCRPNNKPKNGTLHISDLPRELIMRIYHFVVGEELDLASLESIGMVCRGFYLLTKDPSLWRSVCCMTWGKDQVLSTVNQSKLVAEIEHSSIQELQPDWRQMFLDRPRVNFDGVYISRTRYVRPGDVGFQDLKYRPFHVINYYRYIRFFPDRRVLMLTTNEEPDKIIPIFRHALSSKQFSPELSILEGKYVFSNVNQVSIEAEKDCRPSPNSSQNPRRQAQYHWSRQTPISQKFNLKFRLETSKHKQFKNNLLKWSEYTILSRLETCQEVTTFDLTPETFPSLIFSRIKRFNLRMVNPLPSQ